MKSNYFCLSHFTDVLSENSKFNCHHRKTTNVGLCFPLKDDRDKKPRLIFMLQFWAGKTGRKRGANQPLIYIQMRSIQGKLDFSFTSVNEFPGGKSILYHLVALISSFERQELFFITKTEELLPLLATESSDNSHFCSNVQTIPPRPFKTFFTHFNLHMKGDNISKEFCFKFKRKLVSSLCPLCQPTGLILYLKASQPQEDPFVGVIEFSVFIHRWKIAQCTQPL